MLRYKQDVLLVVQSLHAQKIGGRTLRIRQSASKRPSSTPCWMESELVVSIRGRIPGIAHGVGWPQGGVGRRRRNRADHERPRDLALRRANFLLQRANPVQDGSCMRHHGLAFRGQSLEPVAALDDLNAQTFFQLTNAH